MSDNNKPVSVSLHSQKLALRAHLRSLRNALSPDQQHKASEGVLKQLTNHPSYKQAQHIAVYLAQDGELDPALLVKQAWKEGKSVYLPVIEPEHGKTLLFLPWTADTKTVANRYGIPEPDISRYPATGARQLDLILLPLTGFDAAGNRLGMGGGFYDRTLSFIHDDAEPAQPVLIGLAHECQKTAQLPHESWDIPVSAIVTDQHCYQPDG